MSFIQAVILSFVEGISEFLPISSTAHLVLFSNLLGIDQTDFVKSFEIIIQLGAILAIVVLYAKRFFVDRKLILNLLVALLPTLVVGLFLYPFIKVVLIGNYVVSLASLFFGGIALIILELYLKRNKSEKTGTEGLNFKNSFLIGLAQSVSVVPGISRAAATIIGGMLVGLNRSSATEFSFLLAVPTMLAASSLDIYKSRTLLLSGTNFELLAVGFLGSFIFALVAVKFLINFVKKYDFIPFGVYRIVFAIVYSVMLFK